MYRQELKVVNQIIVSTKSEMKSLPRSDWTIDEADHRVAVVGLYRRLSPLYGANVYSMVVVSEGVAGKVVWEVRAKQQENW